MKSFFNKNCQFILNKLGVLFFVLVAIGVQGCGGGGGGSSGGSQGNQTASVQLGISTQPQSLSVNDGGKITLTVAASGNIKPAYQWLKNGSPILGAQSDTYSDFVSYADNGAHYRVIVSGQGAQNVSSADAILTVIPSAVTITKQPVSSLTIVEGSSMGLSVEASGTPSLSYQWYRKTNSSGAVALTGETGQSISFASVPLTDNGMQYVVSITNPAGTVMSDATQLTVTSIPQAPVITTNPPALVTLNVGQSTSISVTATSNQNATYRWLRDGVPITGASSAQYTTGSVSSSDDGSTYAVIVSNPTGSVTSSSTTIHVLIPSSIASQPQSTTVVQGQGASFSVTASGSGPFSYQWYKGGVAIGGAINSTYTTPATGSVDNGSAFTVVVTNSVNSVTSTQAFLGVTSPPTIPTITTQPIDVSGRVGFKASLSVGAVGTAPLSYQWSKNGVPISGATSATYQTPTLTHGDNGATYTATISNASGSPVTSTAATLSVISSITQIATGHFHSLAVNDDGSVWAWGANQSGQLGVATTGITPGQAYHVKNQDGSLFGNVSKVAGGATHSLGLKNDGTVWAWGDGTYGGLGDGAASTHNTTYATAVKMTDGSALSGVSSIAAGVNFSVASKSDGTVWAWGYNRYGKLGDGTLTNRGNPIAVSTSIGTPLTGASKVTAGGDHAAALVGGKVWSWGDNYDGDLGNGALTYSGYAVQVETGPGVLLQNVTDIAAGIYHTVALTSNGTAYVWGTNTSGALGDGTTSKKTRAIQIVNASGTPISGIVGIAAGQNTTLLLMSDGSVMITGDNTYGQLGTNSLTNTFSLRPTQSSISGVELVALTSNHVLIRKNDGNIWAWGYDNAHQLGDLGQVSPVQPIPTKLNGI